MIRNLKKLIGIFVFLLFLSKLAHAQSDARGLYVYTWEVAVDTDPTKPHSALGIQTLLDSLNSPGIDGISLVLNWSSIQTSPTTFAWTNSPPVFQNGENEGTTSMDKWIQQAIVAHKHILLGVRSGQDMPCWLFTPQTTSPACSGYNGAYAGAVAVLPPGQPAGSPSFYVSAHQGRGACTAEWIAAPWDPVFLQQWQTMLAALAAYLKTVSFQGVSEYDAQLLSPPLVAITFPAATATHWYTKLPISGTVQASSAIGQTIVTLNCAGAATGSGADGFGVRVDKEGGPAILRCTATDAAGNQGESIRALWIDDQPPVTTASITTFPTGAVSIRLTATDNLSGVASTQLRINGGPWESGTVIHLATNGTYLIDYRSSDVAGNVEKTQTLTLSVVINACGTTCG